MNAPMTSRERIRLALDHREADRIAIHDAIWKSTLNRWCQEGLPYGVPPEEYFGFEVRRFVPDLSPQFPVRVLERTSEYIVETTPYCGVRRNLIDYSTTPEILDYGIKTREDWEAAKKRLQPSYKRIDWVAFREEYERARNDGLFLTVPVLSGYDLCGFYIRSDALLPLLLTEPAWIRDMAETQADLVIETAKMLMREGYEFDAIWPHNDMAYRNAAFFSLQVYRDLFKPADQRMFDFFHGQGWHVILHSCGHVTPFIPDLIEIGLDCLQALEVKAGLDLVELKREYGPDLTFMGGIDVRAMADPDPDVIEREVARKIPVAMEGGGYIYHSDHSVPNNVSFEQYRRVLEVVRRYGQY